VGPIAGLDTEATGKLLSSLTGDRTSIARSSSPYPDTIPTELPGLRYYHSVHLTSGIFLPASPTKIWMHFSSMPRPSHSLRLLHLNNIYRKVH
jgi:hypothetical protein